MLNGSNTLLNTLTTETGVHSFAIASLDRDHDGIFELMAAGIPSSGNLIDFFNPLTGAGTGGYTGFPVLIGNIAIAGN